MAMISNDWLPALKDEFRKPYYAKLFSFVKEEYATHVVYPPADDIFNAFHFTPLRKVKSLLSWVPQVVGNRHCYVASMA